MKVVIVGQGYVGLPVALAAARCGHEVVGFEIDDRRVGLLREGRSYVGDISDEELAHALAAGYTPTNDGEALAGFDIAVICVPTPLRDRIPDLDAVESAARLLAPHLTRGACVVLESTTYPGTTEELVGPLLAEGSGLRVGADFHLGYSPERIDPGNTTWTLERTPKVVSGVDGASLRAVESFYAQFVAQTVPVASPKEAEMVKLLENTFRHVNIALLNELAVVAHALDIDIWNVVDAASTKPFGFMRFTPGPGVGGHCLPVDPSYLSWAVTQKLGREFRFVELANDINEGMPSYVFDRIVASLGGTVDLSGRAVLVLGLAYKANTSDWRESPSLPLLARLQESGADVRVCDPHVVVIDERDLAHHGLGPLAMVPFSAAQLAAADIVVLLVDHAAFDPDVIVDQARFVLDTKGVLRGRAFTGELL